MADSFRFDDQCLVADAVWFDGHGHDRIQS
jgi:hypothetical protein